MQVHGRSLSPERTGTSSYGVREQKLQYTYIYILLYIYNIYHNYIHIYHRVCVYLFLTCLLLVYCNRFVITQIRPGALFYILSLLSP